MILLVLHKHCLDFFLQDPTLKLSFLLHREVIDFVPGLGIMIVRVYLKAPNSYKYLIQSYFTII